MNEAKEVMAGTVRMIPVQSSNVAAIGYQPAQGGKGCLFVKFVGGSSYRYDDVPGEDWTRFLAAESKGKYFAGHIRGAYPFVKL